MRVPITHSLKAKIFTALVAAGVSAPVAYYATTETVQSEGFLTNLHLDPVGNPSTVC